MKLNNRILIIGRGASWHAFQTDLAPLSSPNSDFAVCSFSFCRKPSSCSSNLRRNSYQSRKQCFRVMFRWEIIFLLTLTPTLTLTLVMSRWQTMSPLSHFARSFVCRCLFSSQASPSMGYTDNTLQPRTFSSSNCSFSTRWVSLKWAVITKACTARNNLQKNKMRSATLLGSLGEESNKMAFQENSGIHAANMIHTGCSDT